MRGGLGGQAPPHPDSFGSRDRAGRRSHRANARLGGASWRRRRRHVFMADRTVRVDRSDDRQVCQHSFLKEHRLLVRLGVTSCPPGDTYCSATINGYIQYDQWGYEFRNSTSYVAQKISQEFAGRNVAGWGNAGNWKKAALNAGYHTDSSPQAGDIAVWSTWAVPPDGQAAYVYAVSAKGVASFDE